MLEEKLEVQKAKIDDVFADTVRIPAAYRVDCNEKAIRNGEIVRIGHKDRKVFAIVRGSEETGAVVLMDEFIRDRLGVRPKDKISRSDIRLANSCEKLFWLLFVTNPIVRVSAWLAAISVGLGVLSIILSLR